MSSSIGGGGEMGEALESSNGRKEVRISGFFAIHCHLAASHCSEDMNTPDFLTKMPEPLQPRDHVMLAAPARHVTKAQVDAAIQAIEAAGFTAVMPEGLLAQQGQFGGSDAHRARVMNQGFESLKIKAIWVMRGGYGCARILPLLNQQAFSDAPTWMVGFSDATALHAWANRLGVMTLHAPVANTYSSCADMEKQAFWRSLTASHAGGKGSLVVGGNLSVLYSLMGTPYFPNLKGNWLLIEDLDEYLYHMDRMMLAFRLAGILDEVKGVLVGSFTQLHDNTIASGQSINNPFGQTMKEIIVSHVPSNKPIHWDLPIGHGTKNVPVVLGESWESQMHHFALEIP
jgi:muramoyltetrapeptide carboxypeptidase